MLFRLTKRGLLAAASLLAMLPASAVAQDASAQADASAQIAAPQDPQPGVTPADTGGDHLHEEQPIEIVITADFVRELDLLGGTSVLTGNELVRDMRPQIGDTLARQPGVSATSFTPGASRPVLRGFQGDRVRVLTDGIGSIDASNASADHAVTIDPLTAERIEVLHGPAVLLFGSQAIGGAVNVLDRRIPRRVPDEPVHIDAIAGYGSAADERSVGASADMPLGGGFVLHVDGSYRKTDDLEVGGHVLTSNLRAEQRELAAEALAEGHAEEAAEAIALAELEGEVPNSATETSTVGVGIAFLRDNLSLGASVTWYRSDYGIPSRPGAEHLHDEEVEAGEEEAHEEEAPVTIDLEQVRGDLRGELELDGGFLESVRLRGAVADYEHVELEGDEIGTVFRTQGMEGRAELVQRERGGWRGITGFQLLDREFEAIGPEAFVPPNRTRQAGLFSLQEVERGRLGLEAAGRVEWSEVKALDIRRSFTTFSAAVGASWEVADRIKAGINLSRTERAPTAEELFSNGPHVATQAFEIGNPDFGKERSSGGEIYLRAQRPEYRFSVAMFGNWFKDYIYQAATGELQQELPVFRYFQDDARYLGFEVEGSARLAEIGQTRIVGDVVADYVRATIDGGGPVPRIPPLRILAGLEAQGAKVDGRIEVEWTAGQERIADFETPTDGHVLVNASVAWRPWGKDRAATLLLSANNLLDVDARRHASFTKDFVPLPGRDIRLGARFSF